MKLKDKVALITGGAQGLGKSIALAMAKEGADIVICDINEATLPGAGKEIEAIGRKCLCRHRIPKHCCNCEEATQAHHCIPQFRK